MLFRSRATSFATATAILDSMFLGNGIALPSKLAGRLAGHHSVLESAGVSFGGMFPNGLVEPAIAIRWVVALGLIAWFGPNTQEIMSKFRPVLHYPPAGSKGYRYAWLVWRPTVVWGVVVTLGAAIALANLWIGTNAEFIYFQF